MLLYLIACDPVALKVDDSGATPADDSGDTDGTTTVIDDSGDDTGTVPDDTGDTLTLPEGDLTFTFGRDTTGLSLTLTPVSADFQTFGDPVLDEPIVGDPLVATLAPSPDLMAPLDGYPDVLAALFLPGVVDDQGVYVAVGYEWPLYLSGDLSGNLEAWGFREGWNVLVYTGGDPTLGDPDDIPVDVWLSTVDSVTIGGTWGGDTSLDEVGIALAPSSEFATSVLYDEIVPTAEPWSITVEGEPPADHVTYDGGLGTAAEIPVSYTDADGSGGVSGGDSILTYACLDASVAILVWADPPETVQGAFGLANIGASVGWNAFAVASDQSFTPIDADTPLVLSTTCTF